MGLKEIAAFKYMIQQLRAMPLGLVLVTLALVPAVFEELCFRGFLVSSLRTVVSAGWAAVVAAILFGLFHEVISPGRLMTTTFIGLVLGWVRVRSGSVLPCIVLHAVHNGLILSVNHWQKELAAKAGASRNKLTCRSSGWQCRRWESSSVRDCFWQPPL